MTIATLPKHIVAPLCAACLFSAMACGAWGQIPGEQQDIIVNPVCPSMSLPAPVLSSWGVQNGRLVLEVAGREKALFQGVTNLREAHWQNLLVGSQFSLVVTNVPAFAHFRAAAAPRPVLVYVPGTVSSAEPVPLVVVLHGFGLTGDNMEESLHITELADEYGFAYCRPDGTPNQYGHRFWNASSSCCDFYNTGVNDVCYLQQLILQAEEHIPIDTKRVCLFGYSNGAFMAHRMAWEHAELISAVACLAGTFAESEPVLPQQPVHVLQIHGTADTTVDYHGGTTALTLGGVHYAASTSHVGAQAAVDWWGVANGCTIWSVDSVPTLDLVTTIRREETIVARYANSPPGGEVELWSIEGGAHLDTLFNPSPTLSRRVIGWLLAHSKP